LVGHIDQLAIKFIKMRKYKCNKKDMAGKITSKIQTKAKDNTVGVIISIVVILVIILVMVISLGIASRDRNTNLSSQDQGISEDEPIPELLSNSRDNSVTFYVERGVTADENQYSVEMTVSANNRTIRVLRGYQNIEERSEGLPNNLEAYEAFLKALGRYDFIESRVDNSGFLFREACPTQRSYRFKLNDGSTQVFDRWHTFCDGNRYGDYGGRVNLTFSLFRNQFPDYSTYTRGISF
jgi:hypothetical protein